MVLWGPSVGLGLGGPFVVVFGPGGTTYCEDNVSRGITYRGGQRIAGDNVSRGTTWGDKTGWEGDQLARHSLRQTQRFFNLFSRATITQEMESPRSYFNLLFRSSSCVSELYIAVLANYA